MSEYLEPADQPVFVASAILQTSNLRRLRAFYENVVGLQVLHQDAEEAELGVPGRRLLSLRQDKALQPNNPRASGLFHLAFLLPRRAHLAQWLRAAMEKQIAIEGASDHKVSEAIYLSDPDGNGVEIYRDRTLAEWPRRADGGVQMATDPLDLQALLREADAPAQPAAAYQAPNETVLGHAHLQVGALGPTSEFYETLGLVETATYPGAAFFGSGGYHHHLALNTWRSRGAGRQPIGCEGLAGLRLQSAKQSSPETLQDPTGLSILLEPASTETRHSAGL